MNIFCDIETIPDQSPGAREEIATSIRHPATLKNPESIQDWHYGTGKYEGVKDAAIEEKWHKTGLDGTYGEVISIAWTASDADWGRNNATILSIYRDLNKLTEKEMLESWVKVVRDDLTERPPYFIGHNIKFDLKFLYHRCIINNVDLPFKLPFNGRHGKDYFCTMEAWCGFGQRISQDRLCKALGIEGKPDGIDGSKVWDFVKAGDIERVVEYNKDDVDKVRQIYGRLT